MPDEVKKKPLVFDSLAELEWHVGMAMPDEYPSVMAAILAQAMIDNGQAFIQPAEKTNGPA